LPVIPLTGLQLNDFCGILGIDHQLRLVVDQGNVAHSFSASIRHDECKHCDMPQKEKQPFALRTSVIPHVTALILPL